MSGKRQKIQQTQLAFMSEGRGEAPMADTRGAEPPTAKRSTESPANTECGREAVGNRENLRKAWKRVQANKGSGGIDGRTVKQWPGYRAKHWPAIRDHRLEGTYQPQPVKRVEIPKNDGGVRRLGIPTVLDRLIQQAVMQVLQGQWDGTFSPHS